MVTPLVLAAVLGSAVLDDDRDLHRRAHLAALDLFPQHENGTFDVLLVWRGHAVSSALVRHCHDVYGIGNAELANLPIAWRDQIDGEPPAVAAFSALWTYHFERASERLAVGIPSIESCELIAQTLEARTQRFQEIVAQNSEAH